MQKGRVVSLVPMVMLLGTALFLRVENSAEPLPTGNDGEITQALKETTQEAPALRSELKAALLRYRDLDEEGRKAATYHRAWEQWQQAEIGSTIRERLQMLSSWDDFLLDTPLRRSSGQVEVLLFHDDQQLEAWFIKEKEGWKLSGIVAPPQPLVLR